MQDPITAAIIGAIEAPAPAHTITATLTGPDGTPYRATYSADMLDSLRTESRVLDIQDDDTGEMIYIKPTETENAPQAATQAPQEAPQAAPVPICTIALNEGDGRQTISWDPADGLMYSDACEEPCDGYSYSSAEEATQAAEIIWSYPAWELEII